MRRWFLLYRIFKTRMRTGIKNDTWQIYEDNLSTKTGYRYIDTDNLDIDPLDPNHVFVSGRTGIYEFQDGIFLKTIPMIIQTMYCKLPVL